MLENKWNKAFTYIFGTQTDIKGYLNITINPYSFCELYEDPKEQRTDCKSLFLK